MVIWFKMISLQPVKPTIISFLCPQFKPTIDVCKPLYKSNVVNAGLSFLHLLGEHTRVVYITYTMATRDLPDQVCVVRPKKPAHHTREYIVKTHGSVSCGPRSRRATPVSILTGRTKTSFSHLCISVITYLIGTKFATQLPASQGSLHSKFEGNRSSHFRDTSYQSFVFFLRFFFLLLRLFAHLQKLL